MKKNQKITDEKKIGNTVFSRIKNSDLVSKKQLLIAKKAAKLFIKKGYQQTTMREISRATGMATGNLYDYISKKEDILCLVFEVYYRHVQESVDAQEAMTGEDPRDQLRSFIHNSLKNAEEFRDEIVLMYRESRLLPKENLKWAMQMELNRIKGLEKIILRGVDRGLLYAQDPFFAASMIFFQLIIPAMRGWTVRGKYSDKELNELIEAYILRTFKV
jgi:TetR/AcrR family transcriptional regulator, cholesterol catabolism regulator